MGNLLLTGCSLIFDAGFNKLPKLKAENKPLKIKYLQNTIRLQNKNIDINNYRGAADLFCA
ncbi:hypothetical protein [Collimonas pratensis]|uniref:Uncharacterized protein n=1 Tax=Collimonas pratensis TaxID=279113 RepID=A0A127R521_9BURK|nr:hypothetical protein [Collimonas pratensis]AMP07720.1 hypothetical protein CPter91_5437 [Collimonas pratensis]AMP17418.1 hypothetical protein CPter291_5208 [Collimonas pratensis]NKI71214.1 hypothetical protein [Collimonas pratensis]